MHPLDPGESRLIQDASCKLDRLPVNSPASAIFDAVNPFVHAEAGLFITIRPGAEYALVSQPVRLLPEILESWLHMPPHLLEPTLAPVILSGPGNLFRDSQTLHGAQREQLEVLRELDGAGLGEGAGYKILERPIPWYGKEHIMLALLAERGKHVPARAQVMLTALHAHIEAAVRRIGLPLLAHKPVHAQIVAEQSLGYICLSPRGCVVEVNRRARQLIERYRGAAGIQGLRGAVEAFAARAREQTRERKPWHIRIDGPPSILEVDAYRLAKETHILAEDTTLLHMRETLEPPGGVRSPLALERLTDQERWVALVLACTDGSFEEAAAQARMNPGTMRTHQQAIFTKLGIQSRLQLMLRFKM